MNQAAVQMRETSLEANASTRAAHVARISLFDFRSYPSADIAFDGRPVAISGDNGSGKTNLLEALSLVGPGRGLRRARLHELARLDGSGGWAVSLRLDGKDGERQLGVGAVADRPDKRICKIDEGAVPSLSALSEEIRFMWLTPAQDRLFLDGAAERRRFVDRLALAHDSAHAKQASTFEHAMRQRQRLLDDGVRDDRWLASLERQMAETGVAVAAARCAMVTRLAGAQIDDDASAFPAADISLEGSLEAALADAMAVDVEDAYAARLAAERGRDAAAGRALEGPHRSDLVVSHRRKQCAARLCSTGEQKALLIGMVIAAARALLNETANCAPLVLLLDEVAAHLDPERRAALFDILGGLRIHTFMTGTDKILFEAWGDRAQFIEIRESRAIPLT